MEASTEAPGADAPTLLNSEQIARDEAERIIRELGKGGDAKTIVDTPRKEASVLSFLLGPPKAQVFGIPVDYDTDDGRRKLRFVVSQVRGDKIREIEKRWAKDGQLGPLAELDDAKIAADTVWEALVAIQDPESPGEQVKKGDPAFLDNGDGQMMSGADAIAQRFAYQFGVIELVAQEIRRISGWNPDRIGTASRMVVEAASGS